MSLSLISCAMSEDSLERRIRLARRRGWKPDLSAILRAYDVNKSIKIVINHFTFCILPALC